MPKSEAIKRFLTDVFGFDVTEYIKQRKCVPVPWGCGKPITRFINSISEREYNISGLCQECQDEIFGKEKSND